MKRFVVPGILLILLSLFVSTGLWGKSRHQKLRFYTYAMGALSHYIPGDSYYILPFSESSTSFAPMVGAGYSMINWADRLFLNLEFDSSFADFNPPDVQNRRAHFYTLMLDVEFRSKWAVPLSFYAGLGMGIIHLSDHSYNHYDGTTHYVPSDNETLLAIALGAKIQVSRKMLLRTEFRALTRPGENYYYTDLWYDYYNGDTGELRATFLSIGLEFHL